MNELTGLLGHVIPLSLGAAVSPTVLIGIVMVLSKSTRPKIAGMSFYLGSILVILGVCLLGILIVAGASNASGGYTNNVSDWIDLILGVFIVILGFRNLSRGRITSKNKKIDNNKIERSRFAQFTRNIALGVGIFSVNFSISS
jgi:uncharacterized membrane protein